MEICRLQLWRYTVSHSRRLQQQKKRILGGKGLKYGQRRSKEGYLTFEWYEIRKGYGIPLTCTMDIRDMSSCQFSPICSLSSSAPWDRYAVADDTMPEVGEGTQQNMSENVDKQID